MLSCAKPTILIVDDDSAILHAFSKIFERRGFSVASASRGKEAKEKLCNNHFDVALIDFSLSDMEGTELFPLIEQASPKTLRILISGKVDVGNIAGADVFVAKPIEPSRLLSIIDTKLKGANIEK